MQLAVYVVEDNPELHENLAGTLEELTCVKVVGGSTTEAAAGQWLAAHPRGWDMAVVDLFLKGGSGIRLIERLQRAHAGQKVVVFSNYVNPAVRKRCGQLGVDAVFDKSTEIDALVDYCAYQCTLLGPDAALAQP